MQQLEEEASMSLWERSIYRTRAIGETIIGRAEGYLKVKRGVHWHNQEELGELVDIGRRFGWREIRIQRETPDMASSP